MNRIAIIALACMMALACTQVYAQEAKVLFFESALAPADTTFSIEPSGFSHGLVVYVEIFVASF